MNPLVIHHRVNGESAVLHCCPGVHCCSLAAAIIFFSQVYSQILSYHSHVFKNTKQHDSWWAKKTIVNAYPPAYNDPPEIVIIVFGSGSINGFLLSFLFPWLFSLSLSSTLLLLLVVVWFVVVCIFNVFCQILLNYVPRTWEKHYVGTDHY